jgi:hypothetical protein
MALTDAQVDRAYRLFYGEGQSLGEVAATLGCGVYALSPWLTAAGMRIASDAAASWKSHADHYFESSQKAHEENAELRMKLRRLRTKVKKLKAAP